jgi:hypothetical protein
MLYLQLIILLVRCDIPTDRETRLVTNFVNLNIKVDSVF